MLGPYCLWCQWDNEVQPRKPSLSKRSMTLKAHQTPEHCTVVYNIHCLPYKVIYLESALEYLWLADAGPWQMTLVALRSGKSWARFNCFAGQTTCLGTLVALTQWLHSNMTSRWDFPSNQTELSDLKVLRESSVGVHIDLRSQQSGTASYIKVFMLLFCTFTHFCCRVLAISWMGLNGLHKLAMWLWTWTESS